MEGWLLQAQRSGIWLCCPYEEHKPVHSTGTQGKEGLEDVGLALRFPSSLGSATPGDSRLWEQITPNISWWKCSNLQKELKCPGGWWNLSGRERYTFIPCTALEEREPCPRHLPPLLGFTGEHREMREQGGTSPSPSLCKRGPNPLWILLSFPIYSSIFKKNRPRKKLPQSKMFPFGLDTERGSNHNKSLPFAKLQRAHFASKSGDKPQQDRWLHRSAAVLFNKRHTMFWKHFNFELIFVSLC